MKLMWVGTVKDFVPAGSPDAEGTEQYVMKMHCHLVRQIIPRLARED